MNHELAKELQDAGFPQEGNGEKYVSHATKETGLKLGGVRMFADEILYLPTLSELIKACVPTKADEFYMETSGDQWVAHYFYVGYFEHSARFIQDKNDGSFLVDLHEKGQTLEEAVARLWLALNKP